MEPGSLYHRVKLIRRSRTRPPKQKCLIPPQVAETDTPRASDVIGLIFMWLIPVGFSVLAGFGIVWFVRNVSNSRPPFF
jgi:hypothetical protein